MNPSNVSDPPSGAEHSAFQAAQSALTRKPLPGPIWAWPVLAAVAAAGLVYLVTSSPPGHVAQRPAEPASTVKSEVAALTPEPAAAAAPAANPAATAEASASAAAPTPPGAPPADAPKDGATAAATPDTASAKASDDSPAAVESASPATKKSKRAAARRASRKHSAKAN
jgi:hypothetical protein